MNRVRFIHPFSTSDSMHTLRTFSRMRVISGQLRTFTRISDEFASRHLGSSTSADIDKICSTIGVSSIDQLIDQTIPGHIRLAEDMVIPGSNSSESGALSKLDKIMSKNVVATNFLGQGYYGTLTPAVIQRNLIENPAWYTAYTPYQAEISQGRLEALMIFQTVVTNLTGMELSNCSLLDEGTAAAESMSMFLRSAGSRDRNVFLVSSSVHPQTIEVLRTRAKYMGVTVEIVNDWNNIPASSAFGALVQFPDTCGRLVDYSEIKNKLAEKNPIQFCVAVDPLALTIVEPPKWADAVVGTMQRFGVPLFYGGPHAAFLATKLNHVRRIPGRLVGQSVDAHGVPAMRLALQTREQHIRLDKATSNICTSQALLANISAMYAVYHGPIGLRRIAENVQELAEEFSTQMRSYRVNDDCVIFGTVTLKTPGAVNICDSLARSHGMNLRALDDQTISVSFDETHSHEDVTRLVVALRECLGTKDMSAEQPLRPLTSSKLARTSPLLPHAIFNSVRTETQMMRYLYKLQQKDLSLTSSMITLGSCTMKLNSASSLAPLSWPSVANVHPFAPAWQTVGYHEMLNGLKSDLAEITGISACSLQPASGAAGEYAGLLVIRRYLDSINQSNRDIVIIPRSAHGTNSASAAMMGMTLKWVDDASSLDEFKKVIEANRDRLAALMITYPSTHGIFDSHIREVCDLVHAAGGNVYMDGANMNAQLGLTSPGSLGADVCHLNLHKTFSIPHGGGGPGMGPICVKSHLSEFLDEIRVGSTQVGQAGIACIPWMFITMLGSAGLRRSAEIAIANANYMVARLKGFYEMPFLNSQSRCSHEFIIDVAPIRESSGVTEEDIAKRLMDYGFHAPTMSWPVHASLMIEPTESESIDELDRFCDAMISIRDEIRRIETGEWDRLDNPLKNAPHTEAAVTASNWTHTYTRETAAFPLEYIRTRGKFWPSVGRVSNSHGDKNLILNIEN
jgi:glycine dehydrogenase